jgi:hypothetical protein
VAEGELISNSIAAVKTVHHKQYIYNAQKRFFHTEGEGHGALRHWTRTFELRSLDIDI